MRRSLTVIITGLCCQLAVPSWSIANEVVQQPLSVIDWLGTDATDSATTDPADQSTEEPPVSVTAATPAISVEPLGEGSPRQIGLAPASLTGLPARLWSGSSADTVIGLISEMPDLTLPAAQSLFYTVLLAEAFAPGGTPAAGDALVLARVAKLQSYGALDPALALIEQAGVTTSSAHFDLWMQISLLAGTEDRACDVLAASPHLTKEYGTRIFCAARAGAWDNAALTLGSAQALGLMPAENLALLDRFLNPDVFEGAAPPVAPSPLDPLSFRLFESIGEPLSTATLPRAYAVADLRKLAGWKAQLEAAERLARAGALPENRLLGLYSDQRAAASGGVWDRVAAIQRFETALETGSAEAVAKTLRPVWEAMRDAGLAVSFASLFSDRLSEVALTGTAGDLARTIGLLSPQYERAAASMAENPFAAQVAVGEMGRTPPKGVIPAAIHQAFDGAAPQSTYIDMAKQERLGEAVLHLLALLQEGAEGKTGSLIDALATLRALGLEDTARRAALQILLMDQET